MQIIIVCFNQYCNLQHLCLQLCRSLTNLTKSSSEFCLCVFKHHDVRHCFVPNLITIDPCGAPTIMLMMTTTTTMKMLQQNDSSCSVLFIPSSWKDVLLCFFVYHSLTTEGTIKFSWTSHHKCMLWWKILITKCQTVQINHFTIFVFLIKFWW